LRNIRIKIIILANLIRIKRRQLISLPNRSYTVRFPRVQFDALSDFRVAQRPTNPYQGP